MGSHSEVNSPIWSDFELILDFMHMTLLPADLTKSGEKCRYCPPGMFTIE